MDILPTYGHSLASHCVMAGLFLPKSVTKGFAKAVSVQFGIQSGLVLPSPKERKRTVQNVLTPSGNFVCTEQSRIWKILKEKVLLHYVIKCCFQPMWNLTTRIVSFIRHQEPPHLFCQASHSTGWRKALWKKLNRKMFKNMSLTYISSQHYSRAGADVAQRASTWLSDASSCVCFVCNAIMCVWVLK